MALHKWHYAFWIMKEVNWGPALLTLRFLDHQRGPLGLRVSDITLFGSSPRRSVGGKLGHPLVTLLFLGLKEVSVGPALVTLCFLNHQGGQFGPRVHHQGPDQTRPDQTLGLFFSISDFIFWNFTKGLAYRHSSGFLRWQHSTSSGWSLGFFLGAFFPFLPDLRATALVWLFNSLVTVSVWNAIFLHPACHRIRF